MRAAAFTDEALCCILFIMSTGEASNKEHHDQNLRAETRAKRLRNAIGGTAVSLYVSLIAVSQSEIVIPQNTTTSVLVGATAGLVAASTFELHTKAKHKHERAVEFAAFEVSESNHEETETPTWALETLEASGKSIDEVLGPRSDQ